MPASFLRRSPAFLSSVFAAAFAVCAPAAIAHDHACADAPKIGRFETASDLLIANFDSKPDVDDLQSIAAFGTVLSDPAFACVDFVATMGAYGVQGGEFIASARLFNLAFGDRWVDAHSDRGGAVAALANRALPVLEAGGNIWITEAGQSDVSAALMRSLPERFWLNVHIVQHGAWNEQTTTPADLDFVRSKATYFKIPDGNARGNGTPGFRTNNRKLWPAFLAHERVGTLWREAKTLSEKFNPVSAYLNPSVEAGGMDFSDTAELAYVFGFADMNGTGDFAARFIVGQK